MDAMQVHIEDTAGDRVVPIALVPDERLSEVAIRIETALQVDGQAVLEFALNTEAIEPGRLVKEFKWPHKPIELRRACVDLHFETESKMHWFPVHTKWARVHRWGCKAFDVATDACANLELREGSPTGPALNERQEIGPSSNCKTVWMVKPGPEPNGR